MSKLPTIDDVAARAGVSTATVSRCLNAPEQVRPKTRAKVDEAVSALGYTPNFGGKVLASNRTGTIGAIIPTMDNAIFAEAMQALEETLARHGRTLFISTSQYDNVREAEQIRALLARGVDGLVLIGSESRPDIDPLLAQRSLPCVNLWTGLPSEGHVTIGFRNEQAARDLAKRVLDLGHKDIAMIAGLTKGNGRAAGRVRGVRAELQAAGVPLCEDWWLETKYSFDHGAKAVEAIMAGAKRPTAIICGNDVLAIGVMMALRKMGLDVPSEVSVVGFDDLDIAHAISPSLTTVRVPHRRMGVAAAEALIAWIDKGERPADITFEAKIIERESLARCGKVSA